MDYLKIVGNKVIDIAILVLIAAIAYVIIISPDETMQIIAKKMDVQIDTSESILDSQSKLMNEIVNLKNQEAEWYIKKREKKINGEGETKSQNVIIEAFVIGKNSPYPNPEFDFERAIDELDIIHDTMFDRYGHLKGISQIFNDWQKLINNLVFYIKNNKPSLLKEYDKIRNI